MLTRRISGLSLIVISFSFLTSCDKDDDTPVYEVPTTYSFNNVEYTEASGRVSMWAGFTGWLGKSTSRELNQDTANYLWNNTNNAFTAETGSNLPFAPAAMNGLGFNLSSKAADAATVKQWVDSMVKVSKSFGATASNGVAGMAGSRLVNYSGLEFNQLVAKGMMGALQLSQVISYLDKSKTEDNNTITAGKGTAMQHSWDMAFGYVGIPKDYDSSKSYVNTDASRPLAIGGYFRERGRFIQAGGRVYEAFRKGRAAIDAKDYNGRDQAIAVIKSYLEKTLAAAAYEYAKLSQGSAALGVKFHAMSECYGFLLALKYRARDSPLTTTNYQTALDNIKTNFYDLAADANNTKLKEIMAILTAAYGKLQS